MSKEIEDLINPEPSGWLQEAEWRQENRAWLDRSFEIAIQVLMSLRKQGKKQKWLAEQLGVPTQRVSRMLNGSEDFTLQSITKMETALGITLIEIVTEKHRPTTDKP